MSEGVEVHPCRNTVAFIGVLATLGALLTACGSQSIAGTYMSRDVSGVSILSLKENGSAISGTQTYTYLPEGATRTYTSTEKVAGTPASGHFALTFTDSISRRSYSATMKNGNLVLTWPGHPGFIVTYARSSAAAAHAAVEKLDEQAH